MRRSENHAARSALLPPAAPGWPSPLTLGPHEEGSRQDGAQGDALIAQIRRAALFWPAPRAGALRPRVVAFGAAAAAAARRGFDDADVAMVDDAAAVAPDRLEAVFGAPRPLALWARLGGLRLDDPTPGLEGPTDRAAARALLARGVGVSPWTGAAISVAEAVEAQALLRAAAMRARGPVGLIGMSRWKRRCVAPFLYGPDGPPRAAQGGDGAVAIWGAPPLSAAADGGALRIEDGLIRSIGLGLRHTPPVSLVIDAAPPYFDATRRNGFEICVAAAAFTPALLARAALLRETAVSMKLTKYNVGAAAPPPCGVGRERVLVAGQVAGDASLRLGALSDVRDDASLLRAARRRHPSAFVLYKPHPDTTTGLRGGRAGDADIAACADAVETNASAEACIAWADRVVTITSLIGFEALLRGKMVTTFGRPFYAGWGLTDDVDPPRRDRTLSLDALTAAALILYPSYIDPVSRLPCPPEIALAALARQRAAARSLGARLTRVWRNGVSWLFNRF